MAGHNPIRVAVVGGGCASIAAAFELSRPQFQRKYQITLYQPGWRLGGKGASARGPAGRIEEHGLHVWMGFYENAFRLLRECYAELNRDPHHYRQADWRDAFSPEPWIGVFDHTARTQWEARISQFPPADGLPGDPLTNHNPFSINAYLVRTAGMVSVLLSAAQMREQASGGSRAQAAEGANAQSQSGAQFAADNVARLVKYGIVVTLAGLIEAAGVLQFALASISSYPDGLILRLLESIGAGARTVLQPLMQSDDEIRWIWEITDLLIAIMVGIVRFGLIADPRGFDAINHYECLEWLSLNGASQETLNSAMVRGLYDLAFAYADGDPQRPAMAAGQGIRGALRMFFTYRGAMFWKMRGGMGDVVFAPFYQVLRRRGVRFEFFHRLQNVKIAEPASLGSGERPYVQALDFDLQALVRGGGEYEPLIDVRGIPGWPSKPDYDQLIDGARLADEAWDFESHWEDRRAARRTLHVNEDFDCVILGIGLGAVPFVCRELVARDRRWQDLVTQCKTVATQAFQLWLREDVASLGWPYSQCTVTAFDKPFDTWADMRHLIPEEGWSAAPKAIAYFCGVLPDAQLPAWSAGTDYQKIAHATVRHNAVEFLNRRIFHLWPNAVNGCGFRWELLMDPACPHFSPAHESAFDSQYWTANVNPSDRYCSSSPDTLQYRISPLDNTYDNLTVAGDWTSCGFEQGCVEAAVMSGRLAAHAISGAPELEDIVGYDHP